ncbi:chemotaxis protein CheB [Aliikangiella coralliicola]|uniref:protein-glutamate methylesterase n=1 Tax=Aliikangiella coralliicola TaxID=2592383 RepID=A0A545UHT1_9GAMM|nr:chemotaxis protein CheB [Aliikangiella coralliicola]TQV89026.1 hypothetical protein FLL46_05715 [Aliikangiella coralliicola]
MSGLKIGLVTSASDEGEQLVQLLHARNAEIVYNITPEEISNQHVEDTELHVWLLNVDDDSWHDAIDHLLDESETPVYFSEPGTIAKQTHPEYWCGNLIERLYEITGLEKTVEETEPSAEVISKETLEAAVSEEKPSTETELQSDSSLSSSLDELEMSTIGIPSDIAAELVSELETISPVLTEELPKVEPVAGVTASEDSIDENQIGEELIGEDPTTEEKTPETSESSPSAGRIGTTVHIEIPEFEEQNLQIDEDTQTEEESINLDDDSNIDGTETDFELEQLGDFELEDFDSQEDETTEQGEAELAIEIDLPTLEEPQIPEVESASDELDELEIESTDDESLDFEIELADFDSDLESEATETSDDSGVLSLEEPGESNELSDLEDVEVSLELGQEPSVLDAQTEISFDAHELESPAETHDEALESNTEEVTSSVGELSLELEDVEEQQKITGKAQYVIDEIGELPEDKANNQEQEKEPEPKEDFGGLSLEPVGQESTTGRANFLGDLSDSEQDAEPEQLSAGNEPEDQIIEQHESTELSEPKNETELQLTEIEGDEPEWLSQKDAEQLATQDVVTSLESESDPVDEEFDISLESFELETGEESEEAFLSEVEDSQVKESQVQENLVQDLDKEDLTLEDYDSDSDSADQDVSLAIEQAHDTGEIEVAAGLELDPAAISEIAQSAIGDAPVAEQATEEAEYQAEVSDSEQIVSDHAVSEETNPEETISDEAVLESALEEPSSDKLELEDSASDEFEIPMLDETASGIEFEENTVAQVASKKAPCWVIGASLGGPAAVKRFMQCLPKDIPASFVIAQHIDENFLPVLAEILTNNSQFEVVVANGSNEMLSGKVFLAPLKGKTVFLQDGSMLVDHSQKWSSPYSPCIDDVIDSVSHAYGELSGAIIFSGMGEDGLIGAKKMRERGGVVWAQSTDTCANSSMPEAVIDNGEVDFVGSPEQLAEKLVDYLNR